MSNFSLYSSIATNNIDVSNRYETLEGEHITINDSIEGELHEIEIFGNTVQNENNLDDIQSIGDLYVDESGKAILDSQGRKQYKIDVVSRSNNLLDESNSDKSEREFKYFNIKLSDSKDYEIFYLDANRTTGSITVKEYGENEELLNTRFLAYNWHANYTPTKGTESIDIIIDTWWIDGIEANKPNVKMMVIEKQVGVAPYPDKYISLYTQYKIKNTSIILPTQLQKVGNIADRLYWNNEKKRYTIEKNIGYELFNGNNNWDVMTGGVWQGDNTVANRTTIENMARGSVNQTFFVQGYKWTKQNEAFSKDEELVCDDGIGKPTIKIIKNKLETLTSDGVNAYFKENPKKIIYTYITPEIIETNITSKLKIPTYKDKTHVYTETENGINQILKVTVDRLSKIAKDAIEEARVNPTTENISLARMYIDMLGESEYKDQLHEQLNQVFSSDITFDKKTATANLDVYIKSENMLLMNLSTNSITFNDYSGVDEMEQENAVKISINSSLPYQLNAYLLDEMYSNDRSKKIGMDRLQIKDNTDTDYKEFADINTKLILKDECSAGNDKEHNIDIMLKGGNAYESDIYKTVIKFEAEQK